jgi:predicted phosphodiesterase
MFFEQVKKYNVEKIIFLGDFTWAAISRLLCASPIPVYSIWWNNDWDKSLITKFSLKEDSNMEVWFDTFDKIELDNRKIFLSHYPMLANPMARSWDFDAVFYWHNHEKHKSKINNCLVINPWEVWAYKTWIATFAIYNTRTNDAEIIEIENSITTNTIESQNKFKEIKFEFNKQKWHQK